MLVYRTSSDICAKPPRPGGISLRLAQLLWLRGARTELEMEQFLHPGPEQLHSPTLLSGMAEAAGLLKGAVESRKKICIYGDYDADGVCATAILMHSLSALGADVSYHIPLRREEGYGMSAAAVRRLAESGVQLIVTVDNGIRAVQEVELCRELGVDVLVTDHHKPGPVLPRANAMVCSMLAGQEYPNRGICGAGLALKLAQAVCGEGALVQGLPLAGLATMADVVPLVGENRAMAALGLAAINRGEQPLGLEALVKAVQGQDGPKPVSGWDMAFLLAPRLNAAGRMGSAALGVELLLSKDKAEAERLAQELNGLNEQRHAEDTAIYREACGMVEKLDITFSRTIVLKSPGWNSAVVGIAAARVAERYHRPTLLLCQEGGVLRGSARSAGGLDLYAALAACEDCFIRFGGHAYAAGVTMQEERFAEFCTRFEQEMAKTPISSLIPVKEYELDVEVSELTGQLAGEIALLEPFGEGNPAPLLRDSSVLFRQLRRVGGNGAHLRATAVHRDSFADVIAFGMGDRFDELLDMERADILYTPVLDEWRGQSRLQLRLKCARAASVGDVGGYIAQRAEKFYDAIIRNILYTERCGSAQLTELEPGGLGSMLKEVAGTLVLCAEPGGAKALLELLNLGAGNGADLGFFAPQGGPAAYNAVVLAPVLEQLELWRYRSIVLWGAGLAPGMAAALKGLAPGARLFQVRQPVPQAVLNELELSREHVAACYRAAGGRRHYNQAEFLGMLAATTGLPGHTCRAALGVMQELGFANELGVARGAPRRELGQSRVFRLLCRPCVPCCSTELCEDGGDFNGL